MEGSGAWVVPVFPPLFSPVLIGVPQPLFVLVGGANGLTGLVGDLSAQKSPRLKGALRLATMFRGLLMGLKAHHLSDCSQIRCQVGMEGRVVVVDGAVGVLESVSGEHTDDGGSSGYFVFALEQACY